MNQSNHEFNGDLWLCRCLEDFGAFKALSDLISNSTVMDAHIASYTAMSVSGTAAPRKIAVQLKDRHFEEIKNLVVHFGAQTIVCLCTSFEVAAREFFKAWFIRRPEHVHEYIDNGSRKGLVPLSEIISAQNRDELMLQLANRASHAAVGGKYGRILKRVEAFSKAAIPNQLSQKIRVLQEQRNEVVHEKGKHSGSAEAIERAHDTVHEAIIYLSIAGKANDVPGRYSCIRQVELGNVSLIG